MASAAGGEDQAMVPPPWLLAAPLVLPPPELPRRLAGRPSLPYSTELLSLQSNTSAAVGSPAAGQTEHTTEDMQQACCRSQPQSAYASTRAAPT